MELKKYKIERSYVPKKDSSRKTEADADTYRRLPSIQREESRRHTASLINKLPKGVFNPQQVRKNA